MNRFGKVLIKLFEVPFQTALDKATNQITAGFPVLAAVTIDFLVDGKASVELKIENGFSLFSS